MKQFGIIAISILITSFTIFAQNVNLKNGLVAYYPFNGNASDESGHGNNGRINGAKFTTDKIGRANSAGYFDGNSYITIPDNNSIDFTTSFSIFAWINIEDVNQNQKIISKIDLKSMDGGYILGIDKAQVYPEIFDKWNQKFGGMKGGNSLQSNTWSLIGVTFNKDKVKYYLNDQCISDFSVTSATLDNNSSNLIIGTNSWESPPTNLMTKGIIDEVRLYNRALNIDEIRALYKDQEEVIIKPLVISWESPSIDYINTEHNYYIIKAFIKSKKPLTSLQIFENNSLYKTIIERGYNVVSHGDYDMALEQKISLLNGNNQIKIVAMNDDGTTSSEIRTINYQRQEMVDPPIISWENPMNFYSNSNQGNVNIKACIKSKRPLNGLQIFVNNLLSVDLSDREYNTNDLSNRGCDIYLDQQISLRDGDNQVKIIASNQAGTTTSEVHTINFQQVIKDITSPSITLIKPEVSRGFKMIGESEQIEILGKASDENGIYNVSVNGMNVYFSHDGTFQTNVTLAYGENTVTIKATDTKQNTAEFTFYVKRNSGPVVFDDNNRINEKRIALVIGNGDYKTCPLRNPVNDARVISEALKILGFKVTTVTNGTQNEMKQAISDYGAALSKDKNTVGLFYYAGHGLQVKGKNYIIPTDAKIEKEPDVEVYCVDLDGLLSNLEYAGNNMNLIILDACRNNPFGRGFRSTAGNGLATVNAPTGTIIAFATAPGSTAADGDGNNGLYTQEFAKVVQIPNIKVEDVFKKVRTQVKTLSKGEQIPWENSALEGDFYFKRQ